MSLPSFFWIGLQYSPYFTSHLILTSNNLFDMFVRKDNYDIIFISNHVVCEKDKPQQKWVAASIQCFSMWTCAATTHSVLRLATGWTALVSNPGTGHIFRNRPDRSWGPFSLLCSEYRVMPGGKAAGVWCWPLTPSTASIKETVDLYL